MNKYIIIKNDREECTFIEARSEASALKQYRRNLLSSGMYWFENICGKVTLCTSYGASFRAEKIGIIPKQLCLPK